MRATPAVLSAVFGIDLVPWARFDLEPLEGLCRLCHGLGRLYLPETVECFTCHGSGLEDDTTPAATRARALMRSIQMAW